MFFLSLFLCSSSPGQSYRLINSVRGRRTKEGRREVTYCTALEGGLRFGPRLMLQLVRLHPFIRGPESDSHESTPAAQGENLKGTDRPTTPLSFPPLSIFARLQKVIKFAERE